MRPIRAVRVEGGGVRRSHGSTIATTIHRVKRLVAERTQALAPSSSTLESRRSASERRLYNSVLVADPSRRGQPRSTLARTLASWPPRVALRGIPRPFLIGGGTGAGGRSQAPRHASRRRRHLTRRALRIYYVIRLRLPSARPSKPSLGPSVLEEPSPRENVAIHPRGLSVAVPRMVHHAWRGSCWTTRSE